VLGCEIRELGGKNYGLRITDYELTAGTTEKPEFSRKYAKHKKEQPKVFRGNSLLLDYLSELPYGLNADFLYFCCPRKGVVSRKELLVESC
jgi:hypothetical protein